MTSMDSGLKSSQLVSYVTSGFVFVPTEAVTVVRVLRQMLKLQLPQRQELCKVQQGVLSLYLNISIV